MTDVNPTKNFANALTSGDQTRWLIIYAIRWGVIKQAGQSAGYSVMYNPMPSDIPANLEKTCLNNANKEYLEEQVRHKEFVKRSKDEVIAKLEEQHIRVHSNHIESSANIGGYRVSQLKDILEIEKVIASSKGLNTAIPSILQRALSKARLDKAEVQKDIERQSAVMNSQVGAFDSDQAYETLKSEKDKALEDARLNQEKLTSAYPEANRVYRQLLTDFYKLGVTGISSEFDAEMANKPKPKRTFTA